MTDTHEQRTLTMDERAHFPRCEQFTGCEGCDAAHLSEIRRFAEGLPDDLGPYFGRDVARTLTALSAELVLLRARLDTAEKALREIRVALSRGEWSDTRRMGTAHAIASDALGLP